MSKTPFDSLSPEARKALQDVFEAEIEQHEANRDPQQLQDIVPWSTWINSNQYSGALSTLVWPYWRREIADFLDSGQSEWIITGSLGGGKSTAAIALLMFKVYELTCYQYPQRLFGLGDISDLVFGIMGPGGATNDESFLRLLRAFDSSPYFDKHCPRNKDRHTVIEFPSRRIRIAHGSGRTRGGSVLSTDLLGVILDEANFYKLGGTSVVGDVGMARDTYNRTKRRRRSRFVTLGQDPSFSLLVSSVDHDASFTELQMAEAQRLDEPVKVTITNPWLTKPEGTYSAETFFVFKGTEEMDPALVNEPIEVAHLLARGFDDTTELYKTASKPGVTIEEVVETLPLMKRQLFVEVPVDFLSDFKSDVKEALKDIAGETVKRVGKLFTSQPLYMRACQAAPLRHPFSAEVFTVSQKGDLSMIDFFLPEVLFDAETLMFKRHPYAHRYVHVDSSETECPTGITMCHQAGVKEDLITRMSLPIIEIDFALRIEAPGKPDRISVMQIVRFWLWLMENYNIVYGAITYDQWGSQGPLDVLQEQNVSCARYGAAGDYGAWKDYVRLFEDGRINLYHYEPLREELFELVDDKTRREILNPNSWKDVMDSQIGAITQCLTNASYSPQQTAAELLEDRIRRVRTPGSRNPAKDEISWALAGYKGRSAKKEHAGQRRGINVEELEVEGDLTNV